MADAEKYVAYVGTYTNGKSKGIHIYDVDVPEGKLFLRKVVPINNSSYITRSRNEKYLYSIADEGVEVFEIQDDGDIIPINKIDINGMRGCHLSTSIDSKYLFVSGYHDGKLTVIHTHHDGRLGSVVDGVFHRGQGAINERCFRPHIVCTRVTPDNQFICAVDEALDQVVIYKMDEIAQKLVQVDILRMGRESGPRSIHFSKNGKRAYILCQITNVVRVYEYTVWAGKPYFELLDEQSTLSDSKDIHDAASAMRLSPDGHYLFAATSGDNSVACFEIDEMTGSLRRMFALPTAGVYPKDVAIFPDQQHFAVVNNGHNTITTFRIDYEKECIYMHNKPKEVDQPNCMVFQRIKRQPEVIEDVPEKVAEARAADLMKK